MARELEAAFLALPLVRPTRRLRDRRGQCILRDSTDIKYSDEQGATMSESEAITEENAAASKKNSVAVSGENRRWRADLHADVPAAIVWANSPPLSLAGEIVFNNFVQYTRQWPGLDVHVRVVQADSELER